MSHHTRVAVDITRWHELRKAAERFAEEQNVVSNRRHWVEAVENFGTSDETVALEWVSGDKKQKHCHLIIRVGENKRHNPYDIGFHPVG